MNSFFGGRRSNFGLFATRLRHGNPEALRAAFVSIMITILIPGLVGATAPAGADEPGGEAPRVAPLESTDFGHYDEQLATLVETALADNPRLHAAWSGVDSRYQRAPQVGALPDLQVQYRYFARSPETRVGPQQHALEISQGVPWKGKRGLQAERANLLAASVAWQAQGLQRELVADLKRAYFEAAYLQEALTINAEERDLLRRFESIALKRYATGKGIQQSVVKVQTDISRLQDREIELQSRYDVVVRRLAALSGDPGRRIELSPIRLLLFKGSFDIGEFERAAVETHPTVRAVESRVEADATWSKSASLENRPDFRFGVGYTFVGDREDAAGVAMPPEDNGKNILALTAGISIPVYRKSRRASVAEAESSLRASSESLEAERDRLQYGIEESVLRVESLRERSDLYSEVLIPQAEESLASAEAAYATNKIGFLDLLDAERVLFKVRLTYRRLLSDHWAALSDLERVVGVPIPDNLGASDD